MPWNRESPMEQRGRLIADWLQGNYNKSQLSRIYGVSRPTVDKWIRRYEAAGWTGLEEHSRSPHRQPNQTPEALVEKLIALKLKHPSFGPKKLISRLAQSEPEQAWPAPSTAGEWLKKEGLVTPRKKKRRTAQYTDPFLSCDQPNQVWSADYKGQFRTGDGRWCYPLTISDNCSRYLLACRSVRGTDYDAARGWFEWAFREYGLPDAIRTDNGVPFASTALGGLSKLSVWWIKLGIQPERIKRGRPDQNGRHERMHKTLKEATAKPPKRNQQEQQRAFNHFVREYNEQRPHEALSMKTPSQCYYASARQYPEKEPELEYSGMEHIRRVRHNGEVRWRGRTVYVSEVLRKEPVGLKRNEQDEWELYYGPIYLGRLNETTLKWSP